MKSLILLLAIAFLSGGLSFFLVQLVMAARVARADKKSDLPNKN